MLKPTYDSVTITWVKTRYLDVDVMEDCYFYAVTKGSELRYIGESYTSVNGRVKQAAHLRRKYANDLTGCWVWFGYITRQNFTRISHDRVLDIESLLIYLNQPNDNVPHKKNYREAGRQNLIVHCKECPHLLPTASIRDGRFTPKTRLLE